MIDAAEKVDSLFDFDGYDDVIDLIDEIVEHQGGNCLCYEMELFECDYPDLAHLRVTWRERFLCWILVIDIGDDIYRAYFSKTIEPWETRDEVVQYFDVGPMPLASQRSS